MTGDRSRPIQTREHAALGFAVRLQRTRLGLSQEALGCDAGLHRNYVGAIERGEINPTFGLLLRLCGGLRLPLSELILSYEIESDRRRAEVSDSLGQRRLR